MQGGYGPVGPGPIGPGLGGFPGIFLLGNTVNRGNGSTLALGAGFLPFALQDAKVVTRCYVMPQSLDILVTCVSVEVQR